MDAFSIQQARTQLFRLVARAERGEEIVVRRGAVPVAKIVPYHVPKGPRRPGALKGQITITDEFDEVPPGFGEDIG
jgi:prevent-host-death family protein